jgi:hypothetical protein
MMLHNSDRDCSTVRKRKRLEVSIMESLDVWGDITVEAEALLIP